MRTFANRSKATQRKTSVRYLTPIRSFDQTRQDNSVHRLKPTVGNQATLRFLEAAEDLGANWRGNASTGFSGHLNRIPKFYGTPNTIQSKLMVNATKDRYEQEADRIADQVVRQKMPEEGEKTLTPQATSLQETPGPEFEVNEEIERRLSLSKGRGNPIPEKVRAFIEPRMHLDLSNIKVHINSEAAQLNQELGARAFAHGRDIYFGVGQYRPQSKEGQHLLIHELAHVLQQAAGNHSIQRSPDPACSDGAVVEVYVYDNERRPRSGVSIRLISMDVPYTTTISGPGPCTRGGYVLRPTNSQGMTSIGVFVEPARYPSEAQLEVGGRRVQGSIYEPVAAGPEPRPGSAFLGRIDIALP